MDIVYPPVCAGCGKVGFRWCSECDGKIVPIKDPACKICAQPAQAGYAICIRCHENKPAFDVVHAVGLYEDPWRKAILSLKFARNFGLTEIFSEKLYKVWKKKGLTPDLLAAVPLAKSHLKKRGYNQTELFTKLLAWISGVPFEPKAIWRTRETSNQVGLSLPARQQNVAGAFLADAKLANGKNILLIDDICTTGSTLHECAKAFKDAGASTVTCMVLARALIHQDMHIPVELQVEDSTHLKFY